MAKTYQFRFPDEVDEETNKVKRQVVVSEPITTTTIVAIEGLREEKERLNNQIETLQIRVDELDLEIDAIKDALDIVE
jgi:predicted  nucleic acid-binding Zn-ribbon protein